MVRAFQLAAIERIEADDAPMPLGHYAQAVRHDGIVYVSGILPVDFGGPPFKAAPFDQQVDRVLAHARAILKEAGAEPRDILKTSVYVTDIGKWPEFNKKYAQFVGDHRPARAVIPV